MRGLPFLMLAVAACATPVLAAPGDMDVATFLAKAEKLEKKGALALFSGDLKTLKREVEAAGEAYRARLASERSAGTAQHSCPPPKGKANMKSDDFMAHLRTYPSARRNTLSVKAAFADLMKQRYPCR